MLLILAICATVSVCAAFSGFTEDPHVGKVGRIVRREERPTAHVPTFDLEEGLTRTSEHYAKTREEVEAVMYNHPSRSPSIDHIGGCGYYHHANDNPPDYESDQAITILPLDFFAPRSTAAFFEEFRDGTSSKSFIKPLIPEGSDPRLTIPDVTAKMLLLILIRDFSPIFSLECSNVTKVPLSFLDEARNLASRNIQHFAEKL